LFVFQPEVPLRITQQAPSIKPVTQPLPLEFQAGFFQAPHAKELVDLFARGK